MFIALLFVVKPYILFWGFRGVSHHCACMLHAKSLHSCQTPCDLWTIARQTPSLQDSPWSGLPCPPPALISVVYTKCCGSAWRREKYWSPWDLERSLRRRGLAVSLNMNTLGLEEKRSPGYATLDRWERDSICRDNRSKSCERGNTGQGMRAGPLWGLLRNVNPSLPPPFPTGWDIMVLGPWWLARKF